MRGAATPLGRFLLMPSGGRHRQRPGLLEFRFWHFGCEATDRNLDCRAPKAEEEELMRAWTLLTMALTLAELLGPASPVMAQGATISDAECQSLRQKLAEHARLSEGVRRALTAAQAA